MEEEIVSNRMGDLSGASLSFLQTDLGALFLLFLGLED
jgi:hypothetical protein